jgi:hypothetical protein
MLLTYGLLVNAALGFSGPYDDILRYRPQSYLRIARRFSPVREERPLLNPRITLEFVATPFAETSGYAEPLVVMGHAHLQYFLYVQHRPGGLSLVSEYEQSKVSYDIDGQQAAPLAIRLSYSPEQRKMIVEANGRQAIEQPVPTLVTAPAEVAIGRDPSLAYVTARTFTGRIQVLKKIIEE